MTLALGGIEMESILDSVKKMLGIESEYTHFDSDIIMHINTTMSVLTQLGVGPKEGYSIADNTTTWSDYVGTDKRLEMIKTYFGLKVRLLFDPPMSSAVMESMKQMLSEYEWRLNVAVETPT